ncbi:MAG: pyridoxamine 5'-phosphate oxidase family protein [Candidatus Korobacteraceae bacterium]
MTLSDEIKQLLDRANFAHLATLMPDGSPQSVPVSAIASLSALVKAL